MGHLHYKNRDHVVFIPGNFYVVHSWSQSQERVYPVFAYFFVNIAVKAISLQMKAEDLGWWDWNCSKAQWHMCFRDSWISGN